MAEPVTVVIDDDEDNTTRVDPVTGTIETDQPDGGVVVNLDAHRPQKADGGDKHFANLVDDIDPNKLSQIANELIDAIEADDRSRKGYLDIRARGLDLLGIKLEEPKSTVGDSSVGIDGMSSVTNPLLLEAILKNWANAQAELLPANGPVKVKDDGEETRTEDDLADVLERDMNHYLTVTASEYYPDTSHMLLWGTYLGGSGFKKAYRCPLRQRPVSESVAVEHLIVSDTTKDLRSCSRITHQIMMRPSLMKRMQAAGVYKDVQLTQPTPQPTPVDAKIAGIQGVAVQKERPEDQPYTVWETQCELDLPEYEPPQWRDKKVPLPFLVTLDKDSRQILAIRRDWDADDPECERMRMYVKYPYVPGPGFYGTGLLNILGNASAAMTAAWREALDCGMFANFPGGLIDKSAVRQNTSNFRVGPGEFAPVETGGRPINQVAMPNPYHDVTPGLITLMDKITEQAKGLGGSIELPVGEGVKDIPVGSMLAQIEIATKVMSAAHKGMHQAQSEEIQLIVELFRAHPEDFWRLNKVGGRQFWDENKLIPALENINLIPVSDPNVPSHAHRVMKAIALLQLRMQFPGKLDDDAVLERCLAALKEDPTGLLVPPEMQQGTPPDPKMIEAMGKIQLQSAKLQELQMKQQALPAQIAADQADAASRERIAGMKIQAEQIIHANDAMKQPHDMQMDRADLQIKAAETAANIQLEQQKLALEAAKHQHERQMGQADVGMRQSEMGLDVARMQHEREQSDREHMLAQSQQSQDREASLREHKVKMKAASKPTPKPKATSKPK